MCFITIVTLYPAPVWVLKATKCTPYLLQADIVPEYDILFQSVTLLTRSRVRSLHNLCYTKKPNLLHIFFVVSAYDMITRLDWQFGEQTCMIGFTLYFSCTICCHDPVQQSWKLPCFSPQFCRGTVRCLYCYFCNRVRVVVNPYRPASLHYDNFRRAVFDKSVSKTEEFMIVLTGERSDKYLHKFVMNSSTQREHDIFGHVILEQIMSSLG